MITMTVYKNINVKMNINALFKDRIYKFYWGNKYEESFLMYIDAPEYDVRNYLKEYIKTDDEYNDVDWSTYLSKLGISNIILDPINIYF